MSGILPLGSVLPSERPSPSPIFQQNVNCDSHCLAKGLPSQGRVDLGNHGKRSKKWGWDWFLGHGRMVHVFRGPCLHCFMWVDFTVINTSVSTTNYGNRPQHVLISYATAGFSLSSSWAPQQSLSVGGLFRRYPGASNTEQVLPDLIVPTSAGFFPLHWYYHSARQWSQDLGCLPLISAFLSSVISQQAWSNWPHNISQISLFWQHQCHCPSLGEYRE